MPTTMSPELARKASSSWIARAASLLLALAISGGLFLYPRFLGAEIEGWRHGMIALTLFGVCGGFIHGVGFVPHSVLWRLVFGPLCAWPVMILGSLAVILS